MKNQIITPRIIPPMAHPDTQSGFDTEKKEKNIIGAMIELMIKHIANDLANTSSLATTYFIKIPERIKATKTTKRHFIRAGPASSIDRPVAEEIKNEKFSAVRLVIVGKNLKPLLAQKKPTK